MGVWVDGGRLKKKRHNRLIHCEVGVVTIIKEVGGSTLAGKGNK